MYSLIRPLLFSLPPEIAHDLTLNALSLMTKVGYQQKTTAKSVRVMGLDFPNPVGLGAGLDKNADYIDGLSQLGFGFLEVGTVTPLPQVGNPKPRLFRLPAAQAIINRMGFNNAGLEVFVKNVREAKYKGVLGINIGKNKEVPLQNAVHDYLKCMDLVYPFASYITINISSPNTPELRELQSTNYLGDLLTSCKAAQHRLAELHGKYVPLAVKIAPDIALATELPAMIKTIEAAKIDGIIATNTTVDKTKVSGLKHGEEAGGLSGAPLLTKTCKVIEAVKFCLTQDIPIIGIGGIQSAEDAIMLKEAGASLVQVYTGLIYQGPTLIKDIVSAW